MQAKIAFYVFPYNLQLQSSSLISISESQKGCFECLFEREAVLECVPVCIVSE